jgi:hypothetical protein
MLTRTGRANQAVIARGQNESTTSGTGRRRLPEWMNRSFDALAAEVKLVDSSSLDVLLYCADDLASGGPREAEVERAI